MSGNLRHDGTVTAAGNGQVCLPTAEKNAQFKKLKALPANQVCFDCPATRPTWASVTFGTCRGEATGLLEPIREVRGPPEMSRFAHRRYVKR